MTIQQYTPVSNFNQFGGLQFLRPNLPKKDFRVVYQDKLNMRITILRKKYYNMAGFGWFQVVSGWFEVVSDGFRCFQVVSCFSKYVSLLSAYISVYKSDVICFSEIYLNSKLHLMTTIWKYLVKILLEMITHLTLNVGESTFIIKTHCLLN